MAGDLSPRNAARRGSASDGVALLIRKKKKGKKKRSGKRNLPSRGKARKILKDKTVRGKSLTEAQRGLFGVIASGKEPTKLRPR